MIMRIKFTKLIKRDLIFGFQNNKYKFIGVALVFIAVIWINIINIQGAIFELGMSSKDANFIYLFFNVFKGIDYKLSPLPVINVPESLTVILLPAAYSLIARSNSRIPILPVSATNL